MPTQCPFPRVMPPLTMKPGCHHHYPCGEGEACHHPWAWTSSWDAAPTGCWKQLRKGTGRHGEKVQQKPTPPWVGFPIDLTEVFHLSPSCKSNKLLVFLTSKTGNTVACSEDPKYSPYVPSHKAPSFPPPCRSRAALRGLQSPSSPASGSLGSRDALKKVASKEHACRAAGLVQGWRGREMESLQQGPCPH